MPTYLVIPLIPGSTDLAQAVASTISEKDRYDLPGGVGWLVHASGTTVELANHIGITSRDPNVLPKVEPALVTLVPAYYGRGPTDMWEWLATRMEK